MITREQVQKRIEALQAEREQFERQAQAQMAAYAGAIQALEQLLQAEVSEVGAPAADGPVDAE